MTVMTPRVVDLSHHNTVKNLKATAVSHPYKDRGLSLDRLQSLLAYDPETGLFRHKTKRGGVKVGDVAGHKNKSNGYIYLGIDGHIYLAHIVAVFSMTGDWPLQEIDHEDLNHANNKWSNLREATPKQNCANRPKRSDSRNPYKGISRKGGKWRAQIVVDGVRRSLGYFDTALEAHQAYMDAARSVHSSFARAS